MRQPKRYIFEESDDDCEEDNLYACHSDTEINADITESQTLQKVYDILTPPNSKKRRIADTPDEIIERGDDNRKCNGNEHYVPLQYDIVRTLYKDVTEILNTTNIDYPVVFTENDRDEGNTPDISNRNHSPFHETEFEDDNATREDILDDNSMNEEAAEIENIPEQNEEAANVFQKQI